MKTQVQATFSGDISTDQVETRLGRLAARLSRTPAQVRAQVVRSGLDVEEARLPGPRVAVDIRPGVFTSERSVVFHGPERAYALLVDHQDVHEGESTLRVTVIAARADEVLVRLPREPANGSSSVWLPRRLVRGLPPPPAPAPQRRSRHRGGRP